MLVPHCCRNNGCGVTLRPITNRQTRDCAAQESPGSRVPAPGAFLTRIGVMSFIATLVSLGVIAGTAVTAVVGYGCYSFLRGLFDKPPRPPEGAVFLRMALDQNPNVRNKLRVNACLAASRSPEIGNWTLGRLANPPCTSRTRGSRDCFLQDHSTP